MRQYFKIFHVYRKRSDGSMHHVTSFRSGSRIEAIKIFSKENNMSLGYYVTGMLQKTNEALDIPFHSQRRIEDRGIKIRRYGYMYEWTMREHFNDDRWIMTDVIHLPKSIIDKYIPKNINSIDITGLFDYLNDITHERKDTTGSI